jgi:RNase P/RNase MRP subunit p30
MKIINTTNLNEARKQLELFVKEKNMGKLKPQETIGVLGQDDEFNRKALEIKNLNFFIINENLAQKDYMKQRNSGLNEVLAKLASKNNLTIGIQLEEILKKDTKEKALSLARLKQNIMLCKKAKTKLRIIGKIEDKRAVSALLQSLGADTKMAEEAVKEDF